MVYVEVMLHGGGAALIIIDGFLLNRIPLRMKRLIISEMYGAIFVLWTVIHAFSGIGNPRRDDDDAIYDVLPWKNDPGKAVMYMVVILFVVNPTIFLLCWAVSRSLPKRLCVQGEPEFKGQEPQSFNDEEAAF